MGILGDAHGLGIIVAIQGLVGGLNELISLNYLNFTSLTNFY